MTIRTQESLSGFIVTDPELTITGRGEARFYATIGQEHFHRNDDGTFTQLETTFHNLAQYRKAAERSHERFRKGDHFVAEGYVHEYDHDVNGETQHGEEFVAKKIGHDTARHNYTVNRRTPAIETVDRNLDTNGITDDSVAAITASVSARPTASSSATRRDQTAVVEPKGVDHTAQTRPSALTL